MDSVSRLAMSMNDDSAPAPPLDLAAVRHVAKLARLDVTDARLETLKEELLANYEIPA